MLPFISRRNEGDWNINMAKEIKGIEGYHPELEKGYQPEWHGHRPIPTAKPAMPPKGGSGLPAAPQQSPNSISDKK
jgi:hypothetical protein